MDLRDEINYDRNIFNSIGVETYITRRQMVDADMMTRLTGLRLGNLCSNCQSLVSPSVWESHVYGYLEIKTFCSSEIRHNSFYFYFRISYLLIFTFLLVFFFWCWKVSAIFILRQSIQSWWPSSEKTLSSQRNLISLGNR